MKKRYYDGQEIMVGDRVSYFDGYKNFYLTVYGPIDAKGLDDRQVRVQWDSHCHRNSFHETSMNVSFKLVERAGDK